MFAARYFAPKFFAKRYFPEGQGIVQPITSIGMGGGWRPGLPGLKLPDTHLVRPRRNVEARGSGEVTLLLKGSGTAIADHLPEPVTHSIVGRVISRRAPYVAPIIVDPPEHEAVGLGVFSFSAEGSAAVRTSHLLRSKAYAVCELDADGKSLAENDSILEEIALAFLTLEEGD